jgi:hypothetical protein
MFQDTLSPAPLANVIPSRTIVESIQPLGQLVTLNTQLAKADIFVGVQQGALNTCGFAANHVAQGSIAAGIDLTAFEESHVTYDDATNTYTLHLPSPHLTGCHIDYIRQYDRSTTACNVDWDEARLLASYVGLIEFRDDALEGGILDSARR